MEFLDNNLNNYNLIGTYNGGAIPYDIYEIKPNLKNICFDSVHFIGVNVLDRSAVSDSSYDDLTKRIDKQLEKIFEGT